MLISEKNKIKNRFDLNPEKMMEAGLHLGHKRSYTHPKMKPYIAGIKNDINIINLEKAIGEFEKTLEFFQKNFLENKIILLVGTKVQVREIVREVAEEWNMPYVNERWIGGILTNFPVIRKRIEHFKDLREKRDKGELDKYTKKERAKIDKEIEDLERKYKGLENLERLPDAIFVLDMKKDKTAIEEARKKNISVIGIADTNVDPWIADYIIPANDDAISSVKYILDKIRKVAKNNKF